MASAREGRDRALRRQRLPKNERRKEKRRGTAAFFCRVQAGSASSRKERKRGGGKPMFAEISAGRGTCDLVRRNFRVRNSKRKKRGAGPAGKGVND